MVFNLFKLFSLGGDTNRYKSSSGSVKLQTKENIKRDWANIQILLAGGQPSQIKQALITADKSLDNALRDSVSGETMGERLKNAKELFDYDLYNKIWGAHKIRNNLVHESGYEPPHHMIVKSVNDLKMALIKLGVRV